MNCGNQVFSTNNTNYTVLLSHQPSTHIPHFSNKHSISPTIPLILISRPKRKSKSLLIHQIAQIDRSVPQRNRQPYSHTFLHPLHYIAHLYTSLPLSIPTLSPIPHTPHLIEHSAPRSPHPQRDRHLHSRGSTAISAQQIAALPIALRRAPRTETPAVEPRHVLSPYVPRFPRFYLGRIGRRTAIFAC